MRNWKKVIKKLKKSNRELRAERDRYKALLKDAALINLGQEKTIKELQNMRQKQIREVAQELYS